MRLHIHPVKTAIFCKGRNLAEFIASDVPQNLVQEKMILAVTSKIVSLSENRTVPTSSVGKAELVRREADEFLGEADFGVLLTRKEGMLIASAGIDESNSAEDDYILYPSDPYASARGLWSDLRKLWNLNELGILLTDSRTNVLRQGVTGICLSHWGFRALKDMVGQEDLFGRKLKMTKINIGDSLAAAAVLTMGEGNESQPIAVIHGAAVDYVPECSPLEVRMPPEEDLYWPFFRK